MEPGSRKEDPPRFKCWACCLGSLGPAWGFRASEELGIFACWVLGLGVGFGGLGLGLGSVSVSGLAYGRGFALLTASSALDLGECVQSL